MARVPQVAVILSGGYYFRTINRLNGDLQPLFAVVKRNEPHVVSLDLTRLTFLGPSGVALLSNPAASDSLPGIMWP